MCFSEKRKRILFISFHSRWSIEKHCNWAPNHIQPSQRTIPTIWCSWRPTFRWAMLGTERPWVRNDPREVSTRGAERIFAVDHVMAIKNWGKWWWTLRFWWILGMSDCQLEWRNQIGISQAHKRRFFWTCVVLRPSDLELVVVCCCYKLQWFYRILRSKVISSLRLLPAPQLHTSPKGEGANRNHEINIHRARQRTFAQHHVPTRIEPPNCQHILSGSMFVFGGVAMEESCRTPLATSIDPVVVTASKRESLKLARWRS